MAKKIYTCPHCLSKWYKRRYTKDGTFSSHEKFVLECQSCGKSFSKKHGEESQQAETPLSQDSKSIL